VELEDGSRWAVVIAVVKIIGTAWQNSDTKVTRSTGIRKQVFRFEFPCMNSVESGYSDSLQDRLTVLALVMSRGDGWMVKMRVGKKAAKYPQTKIECKQVT
jgi:hypothetical protein